ncbi:prolyl 3-hydroxylase 2 [Ixodes scapularis]
MNRVSSLAFLAVAACLVTDVCSKSEILDYEELFASGVEAYLDKRWEHCVRILENAVTIYAQHIDVTVKCRRHCGTANSVLVADCTKFEVYEALADEAACLQNCLREWQLVSVSEDTRRAFGERIPFHYLQKCYSKLGDAKKAASCAYTFLEYNPDHVLMTSYLERYVATPGNDPKDIVSLDQKKYQELYIRAIGLHQRSEYAEECRVVEEVIESYLEAEEDCKILCEDFSPQRIWTRDFPAVATDHLVSALKCKSQCASQLSYFNGRRYRNFFASLYQHLQFCYYHSQNLPRACEANQSFLLLVPDDADMWHNQAFYAQLPNVEEAWFKARKEVVEYLEHQQREQDLLRRLELRINERPTSREVSTTESPPRRNLTVVEDERSLNGSRFVAEGFLTEDQCNSLVELAAEVAVAGDGYDGKQSPHSRFETFNGITLGSIAVLTRKGVVDDELARLLLDTSEQARNYVETYFALRSRLHFSYTHLVCRTAMTVEKEGPRNDMSHAVHADNCLLQPNGDCIKQRPAPIWRDYSAVLYLNDDFKGGDFVFGRSQDAIEARVSPKCGRMVAFSAGPENLHGVLPVERGRRCALALWFTLDPKYRERDMEFASHVLRRAAPQRRRSTAPPGGTRGDAGTPHESALKHGARARLSDEL